MTYGGLKPVAPSFVDDRVTDMFDLKNEDGTFKELLQLPEGFEYDAYHVTGMQMDDGEPVPSWHDGMGCFDRPEGGTTIVMNHELTPASEQATGPDAAHQIISERHSSYFDAWMGGAGGGTSTIEIDADGKVAKSYTSLAGTTRNCAGGTTPWGSWLSCEEDTRKVPDPDALAPSAEMGTRSVCADDSQFVGTAEYGHYCAVGPRADVDDVPDQAPGEFATEADCTGAGYFWVPGGYCNQGTAAPWALGPGYNFWVYCNYWEYFTGTYNGEATESGAAEVEATLASGAGSVCCGGTAMATCATDLQVRGPPGPGDASTRHGYCFEVPAHTGVISDAVPITGMGRFNHEAAVVDPATGYVYETEDRGDGCIYRYLPYEYGNLQAGGELQALKLVDGPSDTSSGMLPSLHVPLAVEWVSLTDAGIDVDPPEEDNLRYMAQGLGATIFARGEGMSFGNGKVYWACTSGGDAGMGQVFSYDDETKTLMLVIESKGADELESPDNMINHPLDGSIYLLEDGGGADHIVGVTPRLHNHDGSGKATNGHVKYDEQLFKLAKNNLNDNELAGGCWNEEGTKIFFAIQSPGILLAVRRSDGNPISFTVDTVCPAGCTAAARRSLTERIQQSMAEPKQQPMRFGRTLLFGSMPHRCPDGCVASY